MTQHAYTRIEATEAGATTPIAEGLLEYHKDTDKLYVSDGTNKNQVYPVSSSSGRLASWDNLPASSHAYDDEFESGSLDAKWTIFDEGTTNDPVTGTIDYTASLTTPIIDVTTVPSFVMYQSDNSTGKKYGLRQTISLDTNATLMAKVSTHGRQTGASDRGNLGMRLGSSTSSTHEVELGFLKGAGSFYTFYTWINNAGAGTFTQSNDFTPNMDCRLFLWKKSNVYYYGFSHGTSGAITMTAVHTKTILTGLDRVDLFTTSGSNTPSIVTGFDYFRYKASLDYSLVNS